MRRVSLAALFSVALAACGGRTETVDGQPQAHHASGSRVYVEAVEREDGRTVVTLVVVNGTDRAQDVAGRSDPPTLAGLDGVAVPGPEEDVSVPAYSSDRVRLTFAGEPDGPLTLRLNPEHGGSGESSADPTFTVSGLEPRTRYAVGPLPTSGSVPAAQANHAGGHSLTVERVVFDTLTTALDVRLVNGSEREVRLSPRSDPAVLLDDRGGRYPVLPPTAAEELRVGAGQVLTGTLRFAGRVVPDARRLTLQINERYGNTEDYATAPRFTVADLPVPR